MLYDTQNNNEIIATIKAANGKTLQFADNTVEVSSQFDTETFTATLSIGDSEVNSSASTILPTQFVEQLDTNITSASAKVILSSTDSEYKVINSGDYVKGANGNQKIYIDSNATGVELDSTIEDIDFDLDSSVFTFGQVGAGDLAIYNQNGDILTTIKSASGKNLVFNDKTMGVSSTFNPSTSSAILSIGGDEIDAIESTTINASNGNHSFNFTTSGTYNIEGFDMGDSIQIDENYDIFFDTSASSIQLGYIDTSDLDPIITINILTNNTELIENVKTSENIEEVKEVTYNQWGDWLL